MNLNFFFLSPIFIKEFPVILFVADLGLHISEFIHQKFELLGVVINNFLSLFFIFDIMTFMPTKERAVRTDALFTS